MSVDATRCTISGLEVGGRNNTDSVTEAQVAAPVSLLRRLKQWLFHRVMRLFMLVYLVALRVSRGIGNLRRKPRTKETVEILLTGTFYSDNWILAHIRPLAGAKRCSRLTVVTTYDTPDIPKVRAIHPPRWLRRIVGRVPSRLLTFSWIAMRDRPDIIGGFHLLLNGLWSALLAPLVGARSLYFCVGGPAEVLDGGIWAENRMFGKMETPDPVVERQLIKAVGAFDLVVTMGTRAVEFFRSHGIKTRYEVVSGGMDTDRFAPGAGSPDSDLVMVGRLADVKRIDLFLGVVERVAQTIPDVKATIVGDGELRESLERLAHELGIADRVAFVGQQSDVQAWLQRAKVFVLTSDSEGLALSMMEAMLCGLPVVVSNVGDLGDLVEDGVNGFLIDQRTPDAFADRITELLTDSSRYDQCSRAARESALRYDVPHVERQWDGILAEVSG